MDDYMWFMFKLTICIVMSIIPLATLGGLIGLITGIYKDTSGKE